MRWKAAKGLPPQWPGHQDPLLSWLLLLLIQVPVCVQKDDHGVLGQPTLSGLHRPRQPTEWGPMAAERSVWPCQVSPGFWGAGAGKPENM